MTVQSKLSLPSHGLDSNDPEIQKVLEGANKKLGFVPNMYSNMVNLPSMLETYLFGYDKFRNESGFNQVEQEVVFLTISYENSCHYCVAAHSMLADSVSKVPGEVTDAIRDGREISDPKLAALSLFTAAMVTQRGWVDKNDTENFLAAGFEEKHILAVLLAISVKTISNYSNHLFDTPVDDIFKSREWHGKT
ncbi:MAG: carboxymuconolactone decarboxylase family protein [Mariprofundus sp.]|nr:carboxymuconolactone decarboxylase family protein [Mariprofundus sp.]